MALKKKKLTPYSQFLCLWSGRRRIWSCRPKVQLCLTPDLSPIIITAGLQLEDRRFIHWSGCTRVAWFICLCIDNIFSLEPGHRKVFYRCNIRNVTLYEILSALCQGYKFTQIRDRHSVRHFCVKKKKKKIKEVLKVTTIIPTPVVLNNQRGSAWQP